MEKDPDAPWRMRHRCCRQGEEVGEQEARNCKTEMRTGSRARVASISTLSASVAVARSGKWFLA
jgi:hypothetical protein